MFKRKETGILRTTWVELDALNNSFDTIVKKQDIDLSSPFNSTTSPQYTIPSVYIHHQRHGFQRHNSYLWLQQKFHIFSTRSPI